MELLPPTGSPHLATQQDITTVRANIAKTELRFEVEDLRADLQALRVEIKADLQDVKNMFPMLMAVNIASIVGTAGLVLGALAIG